MSSQENKECLPPPPPIVPPNVKPIKIEQEHLKKKLPTKAPMARRGLGTKGAKLPLLTNHFEVNVANTNRVFFQYSVCFVFYDSVVFLRTFVLIFLFVGSYYVFVQVALFYEDGRPVEGKGAGRKIIDKVQETYDSELNGKDLAYDGETLFTIGSLAQKKLEFIVVVEDVASNRLKCVDVGF